MKILENESINPSILSTTIKEVERTALNLQKNPPVGYIKIDLSSGGFFGVPKSFWIRNLSTEDTLQLSLASEESLPEFLIPILNQNIWVPENETVNVATWTENQINELLIRLYANFYSPVLTNINFPITEEDITYLIQAENTDMLEQIKKGYAPKIDINLNKLKFIPVPNQIKETIKITKKDGFSITFKIPRFCDLLAIKKIVDENYYETDKKYKKMDESYKNDPDSLSLDERNEVREYSIQKVLFMTKLTKSFYVEKIGDEDISSLASEEKIEKTNDPRIDWSLFNKYEKELKNLKYGIDSEIEVINPFTKKPCIRRFVFRPFNILQIIFASNTDDYDVSYE